MNTQSLIRIVGMWLVIFGGIVILAQDVDIQADEPITVTVGDDPAWLTYTGTAGERITITTLTAITDTAPDTTLEILYPDGQRLDYNDDTILPDGNLKGDAMLQAIELPMDGTYRIRVDSFNGVSAGDVDVLLTTPDNALDVLAIDDLTIVSGDIRDSLIYPIDVSAGSTLTVTARDVSGTIDPILRLYADDTLLTFNDDHRSGDLSLDVLDAQVSDFAIDEDTTINIVVRDYLGRSGTVELIIALE